LLACKHVNCPCALWMVHRMPCGGRTVTSRATFDSSQFPLGSSAVRVPNRHPIWCMRSFPSFFFLLSSIFALTLQKLKAALQFLISSHLVHGFFNLFVLFKKIYEIGFFFYPPSIFLSFRFCPYSFN